MKTSIKALLIPCLVLATAQLTTIPAFASDNDEANRGQFSSADFKFAKEAARGGMYEVSLGNLASSTSKNAAVQQFGQRMVTDHTKAGQDLQKIASQKGATLPTALSSRQQREVEHLSKLNGKDFDKAYVAAMVRAHKADEKAFKKATEEVQDADLKSFANATLPMVQAHLKAAEDLENSVKDEISSTAQP